MGFVVTIVIVLAIIAAGIWIFESDDEHDEWHGY
jgi:hypothetical protein